MLLDVRAPEIVPDPVFTIAIGPLPVVVNVLFNESVPVFKLIPPTAVVERAPVIVVKPVTVEEKAPFTLTASLVVKFIPLEMVIPVKGASWPTVPVKLMLPAPAAKLKAWAPLIVVLKEIFAPVKPVLRETSPVRLIAEAKLIGSFVVVIEPPMITVPVPV